MTLQTFRYAAAGSANAMLGLVIYFISYKYIFAEQAFKFGLYAFKGHVAALFISFCVTFPIGFFLSKYVVFSDSNIRGRVQLVRYLMICLFNLALNYILLKIFVEKFQIYAVLAQIFTIMIVVVFSYIAQRNFSFRAGISEEDPTN